MGASRAGGGMGGGLGAERMSQDVPRPVPRAAAEGPTGADSATGLRPAKRFINEAAALEQAEELLARKG